MDKEGDILKTDPFKEYIMQTEPGKRDKGYAWQTAIGLQAVDGLRPSEYLIATAINNIEGSTNKEDLIKVIEKLQEKYPNATFRILDNNLTTHTN